LATSPDAGVIIAAKTQPQIKQQLIYETAAAERKVHFENNLPRASFGRTTGSDLQEEAATTHLLYRRERSGEEKMYHIPGNLEISKKIPLSVFGHFFIF
jgi:exonuclease V gamma subunit